MAATCAPHQGRPTSTLTQPIALGKIEVSQLEKPVNDHLSELRGQTYWEVFWTQNKHNRPKHGANVDACVKNWLRWVRSKFAKRH